MSERKLEVVNGSDKQWARNRFVLWFGMCGPTYLLVYARGLEDALELCAAWLADNAPGHIEPIWGDEHKNLIKEVCEERGISFPDGFEALPDQAKWDLCAEAEEDLTMTESGFLTSYEWGIQFENPTRQDLKAFLAGD